MCLHIVVICLGMYVYKFYVFYMFVLYRLYVYVLYIYIKIYQTIIKLMSMFHAILAGALLPLTQHCII